MNKYVADFETNNHREDCRVWLAGKMNMDTYDFYTYSNIDLFFNSLNETCVLYFHNLRFDGEFIFYYLFRNDYKYDEKLKEKKSFNITMSDTGMLYMINVRKYNYKIKIIDSLKILPMSVDKMAKAFGLEETKGKIDYNLYRSEDYKANINEIEYLRNDLLIPAKSLNILLNMKLDRLTQASNALKDYQDMVGKKNFRKIYPILTYEEDKIIRKAYKGGYTYLNEKYENKTIKHGMVLDVNSLYPYVMKTKDLPWGQPLKFEGKYKENPNYPLYIQILKCQFKLKKGKLPCIQIKKSVFKDNEYLKESRDKFGNMEDVTLYVTNIDLKLIQEHYKLYNVEYYGGYAFKAGNYFGEYIEKWYNIKNESKKKGNDGMYTLSKLMLNALYGKFGLKPDVKSKSLVYDKINDRVHYKNEEIKERESLYCPIAVFVTAYARDKTIRSAQKEYNHFVYSDTDSIHLDCDYYYKPDLDLDDYELGAWKKEFIILKGKYIKQKCYLEYGIEPGKQKRIYKIAAAGLPKGKVRDKMTFKKFKIGNTFKGGLKSVRVEGGIVLEPAEFTIDG